MPVTLNQIAGSAPNSIEPGFSVTLANGIAAAQTLASAGSASQPTNPWFGINQRRTMNLSARGAGAVPTAVGATVYGSDDGGVTWKAYGAELELVTAGVATDAQPINLVAGRVYQVLITSLTLGSAASASVDGATS